MANKRKYKQRILFSFCCETGLLEEFRYHCWEEHRTVSARLGELMTEALKAAKAKAKAKRQNDGRL